MLKIGKQEFRSQKVALEYVRAILRKNGAWSMITPENHDFSFMINLFERHPDFDYKRGCGISKFAVVRNPFVPKHLCVDIIREDGTRVDISFVTAVSGKKKSLNSMWAGALRREVVEQVLFFREVNFVPGMACPLCGMKLLDIPDVHIDHVNPTFEQLVKEFECFLRTAHIEIPTEFTKDGAHDPIRLCPKDVKIAQLWKRFHKTRAVLRIICRPCNLGIAKKLLARSSQPS